MGIGVIIAVVVAVVSGVASYVTARKAAEAGASKGLLITKQDNNAGIPIIYGERRVGGVKVFKDTGKISVVPQAGRTVLGQNSASADATYNHDGKTLIWLDRVDVLCEGPIHSVTDIEVDGEAYTSSRFNNDGKNNYRAIIMDGSEGQTALTELTSVYPTWRSTAIGHGVAYVQSRFRNHVKTQVYQGEPPVQYQVKGKLIWDPRKDTNYGGTGSHDQTDPSTWEWSDNPALCLLDYLLATYGRSLDISQIDVPTFVTAADSCDSLVAVPPVLTNTTGETIEVYNYILGQLVTVPVGADLPNYRTSQTGTQQKRLTCNAVIDPKESVIDNVKDLLESMKGNLPYHQGKYSLVLEDAATPVMSIGIDDIIGGVTFGSGSQSERFNRVTIKFANRSKRYQDDQVSWPKLGSSEYLAYLAEDNDKELWHEVEIRAITDHYQAEDVAEFIVRNSRASLETEIKTKSKALQLQAGDVIEVSHPTPNWVDKPFRVRGLKVNADLTCTISISEYQDSVYQWSTKANEPDHPDVQIPSPFEELPTLTGLTTTVAEVKSASGVPQGFVTIGWDPVETYMVEDYVLRYKAQADTVFQTMRLDAGTLDRDAAGDDGEYKLSFIAPKSDTTYDIYLNYTTSTGRISEVVTTTVVVPEYRLDLDIELHDIELESGLALTNEAGDPLTRSDLSDLAVYYRDTEARLDSDIITAQATVQSNLDSAEASLLAAQAAADLALTAAQADLATAQADLATLQAEVDSNQISLQAELDAAEADIVTAEAAIVTAQAATATVQSNLDTEVARIDGVTEGLQSTLEDLTASTADVYVQTTAPVAGVSGVPDPIAANSRWFDSDDSNHAYVWDGSTWVSIVDNRIGANQVAITDLEATVDDPTSGVAATSVALGVLDATVVALDGTVTSVASDLVDLTAVVETTDGNVTANSEATAALDVRVVAAEGSIVAQSADIVDLETNLALTDGNVTANSDATTALTTRVESAEDTISVQSGDIVDLTANLSTTDQNVTANSNATAALDVRVVAAEGSIVTQAQDIVDLSAELATIDGNVTGNAEAISGLNVRVTDNEGILSSQATSITALEAELQFNVDILNEDGTNLTDEAGEDIDLENSLSAIVAGSSLATQGLDVRVTETESGLVSQGESIISLESQITDPLIGLQAQSAATDVLTTRVETTEGGLEVQGLSIEALEATVNNTTTGVAATANAIDVVELAIADTETGLTASANRIDALELTVDDPTTGLSATAQALDAVELAITDTETGLSASAGRLDALELTVDDPTAGLAATAQALDVVELAIADTETGLSASAGRLDSLELTVNNATTGVAATAQALDTVEIAIADTETGLSASANAIDALELTVNNATTGVAATAQALDVVELAIADTETGLSASANAIDALELAVNNETTGVAATANALDAVELAIADSETGLAASAGKIDTLEATVNNATTGVAATAQALDVVEIAIADTETGLAASAGKIETLELAVSDSTTGLGATANALDAVELAIADSETGLSASANAIDALELTVNNATTGVAATANALDVVELAIADTETGLSASATKIGALETTVDDPTTGLTARVTATEAFETRIDTAEGEISDLSAEYNVRLDVDGNVAGFGLVAGATSSEFNVLANKFTIVDPAVPAGAGEVPFSVSDGVVTMQNVAINGNLVVDGSITNTQMGDNSVTSDNINVEVVSDISGDLGTVTAGTLQTSSGTGYRVEVSDTGDFPIWYGTGAKNAANGLFYVDSSGQVYVNAIVVAQAGSTVALFNVKASRISQVDFDEAGDELYENVTGGPSVLTISNGSGSYTYAWEHQITAEGNTPSISSSTAANPTFTASVIRYGKSVSVWELTVTDNDTAASVVVPVYVNLIRQSQ